MIDIVDWKDISDDFSDTLLLGNGASMAVDARFGYDSLLEKAEKAGLITPDVRAIFDYLDTKDFELVLRLVRHAYHVNQALGINEARTTKAYSDIRKALVASVRSIHPRFDEVSAKLPAMHRFMQRFDTVLALSYDLMVYWAMMEGNQAWGGNRFKDCFLPRFFEDDWERLREPYSPLEDTTLVFYPHGNLVLASDRDGVESKISQSDWDDLLRTVLRQWDSGDMLPLFASEGTSEQKHAAILRSGYLSTVYNSVMPSLVGTFVVYGCSFEVDEHILRRVGKPSTTRVAISVHKKGQSKRDVNHHCENVKWQLKNVNRKLKVTFFDAQSPGCWLRA